MTDVTSRKASSASMTISGSSGPDDEDRVETDPRPDDRIDNDCVPTATGRCSELPAYLRINISWGPPSVPDPGEARDANRRSSASANQSAIPSSTEQGMLAGRGGTHREIPAMRMGFMVDVVGYGKRTARQKALAQKRVGVWAARVNDDVNAPREGVYQQGTGDGLLQFFPQSLELQRALPALLRSSVSHLAADNDEYKDRLRLRMAVDIGSVGLGSTAGPASPTSLGFTGETATRLGRMVDGQPLRRWLIDHPSHDLAVIISDRLHSLVVAEDVPSLPPHQFTPVTVRVKDATIDAWTWMPAEMALR